MTPILSRLVVLGVLALAGASAPASLITLSGCPSCDGASYSLSFSGVPLADTDPLHETFRVMLNIDTAGVAAAVPGAAALDAASIKVSNSVFASRLVTAPGVLSDWRLLSGGVGAGGCNGAGAGFICAEWMGSGVGFGLGGALNFVFDLTVDNGSLFLATDQAHVKARFVDRRDSKVGALVSNPITLAPEPPRVPGVPVPEPASGALAALALAAAVSVRRRALHAATREA